jgi:membrane fusion protein, heavy metal efflux system
MHSPIDHSKRTELMPSGVMDDRPRTGRFIAGLVIAGIAIGAGVVVYRTDRGRTPDAAPAMARTDEAAFVRDDTRIRIPEGSPLRALLTVQTVAQKEIVRDLVIPAVVEADPARLMKVLPPLAGRIAELRVRLGERVERGQPLLVLDSPDLHSAYADYDRAKVLLDLAAKNRDRLRSLGVGGGVALKDIQQADADLITANAEYQRAEARLRQIGVDPEAASKSRIVAIPAPISGSVLDLAVAPGAYWNDSSASLLTIADLSTIFVTANLPEKDTTRVAEGQPVEVSLLAYPGEVFKGHVSFVSDALEPDTRRTKVRIAFHNPDRRLKPGMFANVTFFAPKEMAPVVPVSALVLRNDASQVFVEVAPWTFEARPVDIRFQQDDQAVIQAGLAAGERAIVKGGVLLND